jgi:hypothetical protein
MAPAPTPCSSSAVKRKPLADIGNELEELEKSFDREDEFYRGESTFKIGPIRVRLYFEPNKYTWLVCFKRDNLFNDSQAHGDSYFRFAASQIANVVRAIEKCVCVIQDVSRMENPPLRITDVLEFNKVEFWERPCCEKIPTGELILRPYQDKKGSYYVRILAPKDSSYKDWLGSSCSLGIEHSAQFAYLLKRFSEYIVATNHHRNAQIEVGINPDENGFSRPSPTTADLIIGTHFPPSLRNNMIRNHSFPSPSSPLAAEDELCTAKDLSMKRDLPDDAENRDPRLQKKMKIDMDDAWGSVPFREDSSSTSNGCTDSQADENLEEGEIRDE